MKFLIITLYMYIYLILFFSHVLLLSCFVHSLRFVIFSFIYFFGKRSVSWFPQRDDVEYCTVNGDEKRPMTRIHTPASSTLQYATELTREIARRN